MNPYWFLRAAEFTEKLVRKSFTFQCTSSLRPRAMGALCEWNQNKSDWAVLHRAEANPDLCNSLYIDKVHSVRAFLHIMWHCYGFVLVASLSLAELELLSSCPKRPTARASQFSKLNYSRVNRCLKEKVSDFCENIRYRAPSRVFTFFRCEWPDDFTHNIPRRFYFYHSMRNRVSWGADTGGMLSPKAAAGSPETFDENPIRRAAMRNLIEFFFRWHHKNAPWNPHRRTRARENLI